MDMPHFAACPKNAKIFFPEIRNPNFGTSIWRIASPKTAKTFFPKTRNPDFGTSCGPFTPILAPWSHFDFFHFSFFRTINGLTNICQNAPKNLPSTARFCTKR